MKVILFSNHFKFDESENFPKGKVLINEMKPTSDLSNGKKLLNEICISRNKNKFEIRKKYKSKKKCLK